MAYVEWDDVAPDKGGTEFLRLKSGNTYKVRPIKLPVHFYKFFYKNKGKLRTATVEEETIGQLMKKYPNELKTKPANRYAIYVIDRADGQVKIMEGPQSVFKPFRNRFDATGKKPGGEKDGGDWMIKVSGSGFGTNYDVTFIDTTPITDEEKEKVKEAWNGDSDKLQKIYKIDTFVEAEKKLFSEEIQEDTSIEEEEDNNMDNSEGEEFEADWG